MHVRALQGLTPCAVCAGRAHTHLRVHLLSLHLSIRAAQTRGSGHRVCVRRPPMGHTLAEVVERSLHMPLADKQRQAKQLLVSLLMVSTIPARPCSASRGSRRQGCGAQHTIVWTCSQLVRLRPHLPY